LLGTYPAQQITVSFYAGTVAALGMARWLMWQYATRGHRLEGIWHSGSPMAGILNLVRGMHVLVPRDMTRAAGFYNIHLYRFRRLK
jgi:hypothetical protein